MKTKQLENFFTQFEERKIELNLLGERKLTEVMEGNITDTTMYITFKVDVVKSPYIVLIDISNLHLIEDGEELLLTLKETKQFIKLLRNNITIK